jgi:hypothetical protein
MLLNRFIVGPPFVMRFSCRKLLYHKSNSGPIFLKPNLDKSVKRYNAKSSPFVWTATADSILEKIKQLCQCISETRQ